MLINGFKKVNIMMIEKLRQLKEKSRMTNQQISERSNIPESTVARIFSGKTPNPTIATVVSMVRAMGGSVADFLTDGESGAEDGADTETSTAVSEGEPADGNVSGDELSARDVHPSDDSPFNEKYYEDIINFYKNSIKKKDEWIARLFWCLISIMVFILFILVFDILHPNFGFVKY